MRKDEDKLIDRERSSISGFLVLFLLVSVTGFVTYAFNGNNTWIQWTYLLHILTGIIFLSPLVLYLLYHIRRVHGQRRAIVYLFGVLLALALIIVAISGFHMSVVGQKEALRWIYNTHVQASFMLLLLMLLHLVIHIITLPKKRKRCGAGSFNTIGLSTLYSSAFGLVIGCLFLLSLTYAYDQLPLRYKDIAIISPYQLNYGANPFSPSQTTTKNQGFLDRRRLSNSDRCGTCHTDIANEWKSSMHAQAGSDKSYQKNINLLAKSKGMVATRYCEGCHSPVALLSGELTEGGRLDTYGHLVEGVGCMGCHGVDNAAHLKGVASYNMNPVNSYLFADSDNWVETKIHNYLIQIQPRQHRKEMSRQVLFQSEFCATCHTQFMDKDMNDWGWVKMQDEYMAWLNSVYSGQNMHEFSSQKISRCQDCHFPLLSLNDPSANKGGLVRSHRSLGANTAIPFYTGDDTQLQLVAEFLKSDKVRVNIEKPNREGATHSDKYISAEVSGDSEAPAYFYLNEKATVNVIVTNAQVGHDFPGGTTDINEVWIHFKVVDSQGLAIFESGAVDINNNVDRNAYFYKSNQIDRHGRHVWRHDLFNVVGDSFKRVIKAGQSDIVSYKFVIPGWAKGPISLTAKIRYRKFNNRYARWALDDPSIELPIIDMALDSISIPLRLKKEIESS